MKTFSFEKLKVWQKSKELSKTIYKTTTGFPDEEKFGITSQMRRCSVSISSNIAEGTGRHGKKDKARFTEIAYGSSLELLNQVITSYELDFLEENQHNTIRNSIEEITKMLDGLYKSQLN